MKRKRRSLIAAVAIGLAGCLDNPQAESGPRNPPSGPDGFVGERQTPPDEDVDGPLVVVSYNFDVADDDTLLVPATVANRSDTDRTGRVICTVRAQEDTFEQEETVELAAGAEANLEFAFDILFEEFAIDGRVTVDIQEA